MRVRIELDNPGEARLPVDHQDLLAAAVYRLLGVSDEAYSARLHDEGYSPDGGFRKYKLFCFSNLRVGKDRRRIERDRLILRSGRVDWFIASPMAAFQTHFVTGSLHQGEVRVGSAVFPIAGAEALPLPTFRETTRFTCMTPLVASVWEPDRKPPRYLRPQEGEAFSEAVRSNLLNRYRLAYGAPPADDRLELKFDQSYLEKDRHGGTKKVTYKGIDVIGAMAPFTLTGSGELMRLAWEGGLVEKNSGGFGMVEVKP
jgi:CRISPR-associated endoribonuclease Cas6